MCTVDVNGTNFRKIAMDDCLALVEGFQAAGKKWHSHVLSPICNHNPFAGCYAVVVEDDAEGVPYIAQGDASFPEIDKAFVKMLHGDDILDAAAVTGDLPDSLLVDHVRGLQARGAPWHHHMHFPTCAFNPHPGQWSISIEAQGSFMSEAYADEPIDVLRQVEVYYFDNLAKATA
ncbi:hypothetical protein Q9295_17205 [Xinfangfangia sp. CPCC 101601]|uniref:Uncharacterized protein n=1 Tax=Pseudogemmobacter lacusdianii TaxID=3069608 RepID=A0ABU0W2U9_9RHOB|nr:hypothetical protein [Xinfangfangia sp. CPCC 101601]MDQ2068113.1 hypothetical protein [Xinfangfangia sp. CPCC 101601]